jgi:diadenosine tetraphosphatase ApaH/serine/threonine PP2A family protein phosphatase
VRILVVSDIHGNLEALRTVLTAAGTVDAVWCLGDTVGYGPEPDACVQTVRELPHAAVAGNHDCAAIGTLDISGFNPDAAAAARWTGSKLTPETRAYLADLPLTRVEDNFTLAHGSPRDPLWEYLFQSRDAEANFAHFATAYCLVGHTHVPAVAAWRNGRVSMDYARDGDELDLGEVEARFILNPGSVGQPRDRDPRAGYLLLDTGAQRATWHRVAYDISSTQRLMEQQALPHRLIDRLTVGR